MKNVIFNVQPPQTCMVVERERELSQLSKKILTRHGEHACGEPVEPVEPRYCEALPRACRRDVRRSNLLTHPPLQVEPINCHAERSRRDRSPITVFLLTFTFITFNLLITAAFVMMSVVEAFSQGNVGINSTGINPDASSVLDVAADGATKGGMLIPRVSLTSTVDVATIATPANALVVYNTNAAMTNGNGVGFYYYCSSGCTTIGWKFMSAADNGPGITGQILASQGSGNNPQWSTLSTSSSGCGGCPTMISVESPGSGNWGTQAAYCRNLTESGYSDWRMPTFDELTYAVVYLTPPTAYSANYLWTATKDDLSNGTGTGDSNYWLILHPSAGYWTYNDYTAAYCVRCVR